MKYTLVEYNNMLGEKCSTINDALSEIKLKYTLIKNLIMEKHNNWIYDEDNSCQYTQNHENSELIIIFNDDSNVYKYKCSAQKRLYGIEYHITKLKDDVLIKYAGKIF